MGVVGIMRWYVCLLAIFLLASRIDSAKNATSDVEGAWENESNFTEAQHTHGAAPGDVPFEDQEDEDLAADDGALEELEAEDGDVSEPKQKWWYIRRRREPSCEDYGCLPFYSPAADCQCFITCDFWGSCCDDYIEECLWPFHHVDLAANGTLERLYYSTTPMMARVLLTRSSALQPQADGLCGQGLYLATSPRDADTKAASRGGPTGAVLEVFIDLGLVKDAGDSCDAATAAGSAREEGYDAVLFNPGDGAEYVVYDSARVKGMRR